jgi:hypothetical protein
MNTTSHNESPHRQNIKQADPFYKRFFQGHYFLYLAPLVFLWNGYNDLFGWISGSSLFLTGLLIYLLLGIVYFALSKFLDTRSKRVLSTAFILTVVMLYGYLHDTLKSWAPNSFFSSYSFFIPFLVLIALAVTIRIRKNHSGFTKLLLYCNTLIILLLATEIVKSVLHFREYQKTRNLIDPRFNVFKDYQKSTVPEHEKPDIFFIIFDELASTGSLMRKCNINNSGIEHLLQKEGFYTASDARSNYDRTFFSISSTMNMEYLPVKPQDQLDALFKAGNSMLNNSLIQILKSEGYATYQLQPISSRNNDWPETSIFDERRNNHIFYKTLPGRIIRDLSWHFYDRMPKLLQSIEYNAYLRKKQSIETPWKQIKKLCNKSEKPKFVYAHFMVPHAPNFFKKDGSWMSHLERKRKSEYELYQEQVLYANTIITDITRTIKLQNKKNTIILIAGDHGYRYQTKPGTPENFEIFCSLYFPDQDYTHLQQDLNPANYFRIILNRYFHCRYNLLPYQAFTTETTQQGKQDPDLH